MKENQFEILCMNGDKETDLFSGMFGSNGITNKDKDGFQKVQQLDRDVLLLDCSFKSIKNKFHVFPTKDDKKSQFHCIAPKTDEEDALDKNVSPSDATDKSVIEHELPESIVCCKDEKCNPIRDICVDEGAHTVDIVDDVSGKEPFCDKLLLLEPSSTQNSQSSLVSLNCNGSTCGVLLDKKPPEDRILLDHNATSKTDESNEKDVPEFPETCLVYSNMVESKSTIDKNTTSVADRNGNENGCRQPQEFQDDVVPNSEVKAKVNHSISGQQDKFADGGEASFSGLSSLITSSYAGLIPYSGSISLRSDSSTTSARSFAFPVIQSEWNSSPEKMKRSYKRSWKHMSCWRRLLCCRF
ncbi:unnamed protein product [Cuscuta epithymum]|uniref:Uncharacterized protein n=1 Tax=Cuscuta epithymum TaxID=186058 RepID=A0AAV0F093_9ASTE|nr:unnamed protein product [Cuscuta epithymum]